MSNWDFSGWATRNNVRCSDGRTILKDAFAHNDGSTVPLIWNHQHNSPFAVLGHALLENRDEGVYMYGSFNDTESGKEAKALVMHGDVDAISIYANQLKEQGGNVHYGNIREVSLVHAGANPGAYIENVLAHGDDGEDGLGVKIFTGMNINVLMHSDCKDEKKTAEHSDIEDDDEKKEETSDTSEKDDVTPEKETDNEDIIDAEGEVATVNKKKDEIAHSDDDKENNNMAEEAKKELTVGEVIDSMTEEQKNVMYALIGQALEDAGVKNDSEEGEEDMKHNVFENDEMNQGTVLSHSDLETIFTDAKTCGSLRDSFLAHTQEYGIENIEYLFPDAKTLNNTPEFIKRDTDWVKAVMDGVHHSPFARVKSIFANITEEEARAKGYIKGKLKKNEVFKLLKRVTNPTTIYKKQQLDRDDIIDIVDLDVVAWLKQEMRIMWDEEAARAILIGDGRDDSSNDKINSECIRPIVDDDALYTIKWNVAAGADEDELAANVIKAAVKSRKNYKGSGNPVMFTTEDMLTTMLLLEDKIGHRLYKTEAELATALRVQKIYTVPVMEGFKDKDEKEVYGIIVNLADYNAGADKGGAMSFFDDFDIDYNQQKYLMEARMSGALVKPYSAIVLRAAGASAEGLPQE